MYYLFAFIVSVIENLAIFIEWDGKITTTAASKLRREMDVWLTWFGIYLGPYGSFGRFRFQVVLPACSISSATSLLGDRKLVQLFDELPNLILTLNERPVGWIKA